MLELEAGKSYRSEEDGTGWPILQENGLWIGLYRKPTGMFVVKYWRADGTWHGNNKHLIPHRPWDLQAEL